MPLKTSRCGRTPLSLAFSVLLGGIALGAPAQALTLTVTNSNDSGPGSLRQAITTANITSAADTIVFGIGSGARTIALQSSLPTITTPLTIDGITQPGFAGRPLITINGAQTGGAGSGVNGLTLQAANCVVNSLVINGFGASGIFINGTAAAGNTVKGCYIGTNAAGTAAQPNASNGITILDAKNNTIGGLSAAERNIISGNANGINIIGTGADSNRIQGNYIGTSVTGNAALPNINAGLFIEAGAKNNLVGGTTATARNIISGNGGTGVIFFDPGTDGNRVQGNFIGTNVAGSTAIPNRADGVTIGNGSGRGGPKNTLIGGLSASTNGAPGSAPGNVISGNDGNSITISGAGTNNTLVQSNLLGTNVSGTVALKPVGNSSAGVHISSGAQAVTVGAASLRARNVIAGNDSGIAIFGDGPTDQLTVSHVVQGNYIGTNMAGSAAISNRLGVLIIASKNNTIGAATTNLGQAPGNVIAGNREFQVRILGNGATNNLVQGNLLGTNQLGSAALGNAFTGVGIDSGAKNNLIGGAATNLRNVISGNNTGLHIQNVGTEGNRVQGNYIGTNKAGAAAIANTGVGILLSDTAKNNLIGGLAATRGQPPGNLISGNTSGGIVIISNGTEANTIQGNAVGTNAAGTAAIVNAVAGITVLEGASRNIIGGTATGAGNLVSGNETGIAMHVGATANQVQGNFVGTDITGLRAVPNRFAGVLITSSAEQNVIGGTTAAARNLISGNSTGVSIDNGGTDNNIVQGNYIGVNANRAALGNTVVGVEVTSGSFGNLIGAPASANDATTRAAANIIAFNGNSGVRVSEEDTANCTIRGNLIFSNGGLGINLEPGNENPDANTAKLPTANDNGDADTGPNKLQNFPFLSALTTASGTTRVSGSLNSRPGTTYVLDFYRNTQGDPSGFGEGEIYLGAQRVTTNAAGNVIFAFNISGTFTGPVISATATNLTTGETSEFSPLTSSNVVTNTNDAGIGSLRTALSVAQSADNTAILFRIPASLASGGVFSIRPATPLPALIRNGITVDGSAQTAFTGNTNAAGPEIVIHGGLIPAGGLEPGFNINGDNCLIRNLVINRFPTGINIEAAGSNTIASGNRIEGCYIGLSATGTASTATLIEDDGVRLADDGFTPGSGAANNIIGGLAAASRNVISNCRRYGVVMSGAATSGNVVQGNLIGTNVAGNSPIANNRGIGIFSGAHDNLIGGTVAAARNVLFGNGEIGLVYLSDSGTNGNRIQGNYIGITQDGSAALVTGANVPDIFGVRVVNGARSNQIGGTEPGAGNVIGGLTNGIGLTSSHNNLVQGNIIGLNASGTAAIPNIGNGIILSAGSQNNIVGATRSMTGAAVVSAGNRIAFNNTGDGIRVFANPSDQTTGNTIRGNRVFSNGGLGINLFPSTEAAGTATPNDNGDGDSGPNNLQNTPVIASATTSGSTTTVTGAFRSTPNQSFVLDLYRNTGDASSCSATGNLAEGETYVTSQSVITRADGSATFAFSVNSAGGQVFTATATNTTTGDTSEFSPVPLGNGATVVTNTRDSGPGSLRVALATAGTCGDTISFDIPTGDSGYNSTTGVFTIQVASPLPILASNGIILDGTSQPGYINRPIILLNGTAAGADATGIEIQAANCTVKGLIIGGFKGRQLRISGLGSNLNIVQGCYIGTNASGNAGIPGGGSGILIDAGARNNKIGGTSAGEGNRIAFNGGAGIIIGNGSSDTSAGNAVRGNRIFGNNGLGINLNGGRQSSYGDTANDNGDADTGPNNLQNFPILTNIRLSGTSAITGTVDVALNSRPNTSFAIDFYRVSAPDPSGFGEGEFFLGSRTITTDADGNFASTLSFSLGGNFAEQSLSATVTSLTTGNTSEFSPTQTLTGTVNTWGYNNLGQLGDGSTTNKLQPNAINLNGVSTLSAGGAHSLAVKSDGTVWSWGNNGAGQLGDGTGTNRSTPVQVPGLFDVQGVAGGWYHSLALKRDGTVWSWGSNTFGQLGDGTTLVSALPVKVNNLTDVVAIAAGVYYSAALKSDGTVWCWGSNIYGQLGDGTTANRTTPVQVRGTSGIRAIAAGAGHTVLLTSGGNVLTLGWNANGQLGNGNTANSSTPITVGGLARIGAITAGYAHTLALDSSGTGLSAWGNNASGQLGNGTTTNRPTPVRVSNLSGIRLIAAGSSHSLAVKNDGTLWSWGNNIYGAVGDGTTVNKTVPVKVPGLVDVGVISGGFSHSMALGTRAGVVLPRLTTPPSFQWSRVIAQSHYDTILLRSFTALDATANDASHYEVTVNGVDATIEAVIYSVATNGVTLKLAPGSLQDMGKVEVIWTGLRNANQQPLLDGRQAATRG